MYKIIAKCPVVVYDGFTSDGDYNRVKDKTILEKFNNYIDPEMIVPGDDLTEFIEVDDTILCFLRPPILQYGAPIYLSYDNAKNMLSMKSVFVSENKLTAMQIKEFMDNYSGQMYDGLGEGFLHELENENSFSFQIDEDNGNTMTFKQLKIEDNHFDLPENYVPQPNYYSKEETTQIIESREKYFASLKKKWWQFWK